ncbi:MAG: hypothetical protein J3Q66DRAFT_352751 [Benniella sp.]|nr:MAG: hypothetical protein J3Q66DRAFT_352751 [Benniella sp.]
MEMSASFALLAFSRYTLARSSACCAERLARGDEIIPPNTMLLLLKFGSNIDFYPDECGPSLSVDNDHPGIFWLFGLFYLGSCENLGSDLGSSQIYQAVRMITLIGSNQLQIDRSV